MAKRKSAAKPKAAPVAAEKRPGPGQPPKLVADSPTLAKLRGLGQIQATRRETAQVMGVANETLSRFFAAHPHALEVYEMGKAEGRVSLRRTQFKMAQTNASMAIFLGKNILGQSDTIEHLPLGGSAIASEYRLALAEMDPAKREVLMKLLSEAVVKLPPQDPKLIEGTARESE